MTRFTSVIGQSWPGIDGIKRLFILYARLVSHPCYYMRDLLFLAYEVGTHTAVWDTTFAALPRRKTSR